MQNSVEQLAVEGIAKLQDSWRALLVRTGETLGSLHNQRKAA